MTGIDPKGQQEPPRPHWQVGVGVLAEALTLVVTVVGIAVNLGYGTVPALTIAATVAVAATELFRRFAERGRKNGE
jgi:hypothetical protein